MVKTTVVIRDELYEALVQFSQNTLHGKRKVSAALNSILGDFFGRRKDMYGILKATPKQRALMYKDLREKNDGLD
ncbi:MAG: hypothetical protein V1787_02630 [Candidatus Micrarchaeota archaeon]